MEIHNLKDMKGGWFVGDFVPSVMRTKDFEVGYKKYRKGEKWDKHYHLISTEITLLIRGKMLMQGKEILPGEIFILSPKEVADPIFLEDCEVVIVKTPSSVDDKYVVNEDQ
jgi:quercetin dioxygenase-like cupin family protein